MYKIGIIGDRDSVLGYMALGFSVHEAENAQIAGEELREMAKSGEYAIIFIVESYAMKLSEQISAYKDDPLPAVICIPGKSGNIGYGMANIRESVIRAVGTDVLFKN